MSVEDLPALNHATRAAWIMYHSNQLLHHGKRIDAQLARASGVRLSFAQLDSLHTARSAADPAWESRDGG
eukprot:8407863-Alexandrium_andersonii.AAC.1